MKTMKNTKNFTANLEEQINKPFENDDNLLSLAWSMSSYMQLDSCSPVYVLL